MNPPRILIVEDDPLVANAIEVLLEMHGFEVAFASNGKAALATWQALAPDLIITDMVMPEVDGVMLIRSVRAQNPHLPVLAISGRGPERGELYLTLAERMGADCSLKKPVSGNLLLSTINRLLARSDQLATSTR
ncbi:MAG: response regulator [Nitrosomonadales bacterium]|nr:response regulator [Nitrosomonadales bacterium]